MEKKTVDIPIEAVKEIATRYGYDQVIIIARKVGANGHEHCTTYGVDKTHCDVAARCGDFLKYKVMGWIKEQPAPPPAAPPKRMMAANQAQQDLAGEPYNRHGKLHEEGVNCDTLKCQPLPPETMKRMASPAAPPKRMMAGPKEGHNEEHSYKAGCNEYPPCKPLPPETKPRMMLSPSGKKHSLTDECSATCCVPVVETPKA